MHAQSFLVDTSINFKSFWINIFIISSFCEFRIPLKITSPLLLKQLDYVFCNILAEVIKGMIPNIYKSLRDNGEVIFSGILNSQKDEIIKILIQNNLNLLDVSTRKDWACISAQKNQ